MASMAGVLAQPGAPAAPPSTHSAQTCLHTCPAPPQPSPLPTAFVAVSVKVNASPVSSRPAAPAGERMGGSDASALRCFRRRRRRRPGWGHPASLHACLGPAAALESGADCGRPEQRSMRRGCPCFGPQSRTLRVPAAQTPNAPCVPTAVQGFGERLQPARARRRPRQHLPPPPTTPVAATRARQSSRRRSMVAGWSKQKRGCVLGWPARPHGGPR